MELKAHSLQRVWGSAPGKIYWRSSHLLGHRQTVFLFVSLMSLNIAFTYSKIPFFDAYSFMSLTQP